MNTTLKTASVLAFEAKLANSDAIMASGNWEERANANSFLPVTVKEKAVRGTISNRLKSALASDPAKVDAEVQKANLQTVDNAALPFEHDTLKVSFTLRVIGDLATPSTCNDPEYQQALASLINGYAEQTQFTELANRYAANIANGRFLWRNRVGAEAVEVQVTHGNEPWVFDSQQFDLRSFAEPKGDLAKLAQVIKQGLTGESFALLKVNAFVKLGAGQAVYPSQELVMGGGKGDKSKFLYQLDGVAAMHSQKIGNALRTIDTWHPETAEVGAIAVEPYGSVTNRGKAYRQPKDNMDFYKLLDSWVLKGKTPSLEQQHYIMAMFIRGGVFGEAG
ncbi:type I-F CRISPR-associated protein Csy3 [Alishewanella tabrizica]|uniref:CRISPR-associated protein Csy3 n=1 Tax=Alishewanella tabrizica TaxID=671278 RepID=A0ABQ2WFB8_9ALTE|nr:type I-F CRISPR-associated protein Csy3 [Alishewanella tabrizica]GGW53438.1 CRISPR-associated protein Csy3 [Alishewanella tabrizica]